MLDISVGQTFKATQMAMNDLDRLVDARVPSMDRRNTSSMPSNFDRSDDFGMHCLGASNAWVGDEIEGATRCIVVVLIVMNAALPFTDVSIAIAMTILFERAMIGIIRYSVVYHSLRLLLVAFCGGGDATTYCRRRPSWRRRR